MKRPITLLLLSILLSACNLLPQPATPTPAGTATPLPPTETSTSNLPPTYTLTPTQIGAKPSSTATETPPPTNTFLLITLPTGTPEPTDEPEILPSATLTGLEGTGFESVTITESVFHWGSCAPTKSTMTVKVKNSTEVFSVVVFLKFRNKVTGSDTGWDDGTGLDNMGGGTFSFTFDGNQLGVYANSWMVYQLVATGSGGNELTRSPSFPDKLSISPCP